MENNRLEEKIDKISDKISSIDVTLAKNTVSLEEHIKRTNILEQKLGPVEKHVNMVDGALKLIAVAAMVATIAESIHLIFK